MVVGGALTMYHAHTVGAHACTVTQWMDAPFDVIVVGAGVEGSATAYQLIKHGASRVLLLEQVTIILLKILTASVY